MTENKSDNQDQVYVISDEGKTVLTKPQTDNHKKGLTIPLPNPQQSEDTQTNSNTSKETD
jgi:hypothetical protein